MAKKTIKRTLTLFEARNIMAWYKDFSEKELEEGTTKVKLLPMRTQWLLLSNIKQLSPTVAAYEEFVNKFFEDVRNVYFDEEHSDEVKVPRVDEKGNPVLDENGEQIIDDSRKVKDEFVDEYVEKSNKAKAEEEELFKDATTYTFSGLDLLDLATYVDENKITSIDVNDFNMMSFCDIAEADKEEE